jgi:hypothetical protein
MNSIYDERRTNLSDHREAWQGLRTGRDAVVQSRIEGGFGSDCFDSMRCVIIEFVTFDRKVFTHVHLRASLGAAVDAR